MNTIYISGPMSGYPDFNRPAFWQAERKLMGSLEARFINPARINGEEKPGWEWGDYMRVALAAMMEADSIYMLNDWEKSRGAKLELKIAQELGMRVMYQPVPVMDWRYLTSCGVLILDTETTGLGEDAEIVELCLLDAGGTEIINTLVKPSQPIPEEVIKIHGITNEMVADAPGWAEVSAKLSRALDDYRDSRLVIWNSDYDLRLIRQSDKIAGIESHRRVIWSDGVLCAQLDYAYRYGERRPDGMIKRQSLANACQQLGISHDPLEAHRALYDCQQVSRIINQLIGG